MTITIAVTGKSGSGKTTLTKSILNSLHSSYPDKSILLIDNDLSQELGTSFGVDVQNTIYDVISAKYKYSSKIPEGMTKYEYIKWVLQDLTVNLFDEVDLITTGPISTKECNCYTSSLINDALIKTLRAYDIVIFDCEYDLYYLNRLVDYPVDITLIVSKTSISAIYLASKIMESSAKLAVPGQLGVVLNKIRNQPITDRISDLVEQYDIDVLGILPYDEKLACDDISKSSDMLVESTKEMLFRLNLPPL